MSRKKTIWDLQRISPSEFKESEKLPLAVVLDNIRSLSNVGAILRTSDAFRIDKVMLCGVTGCPPSTEIHKTALGAEDSVEWRYFASTLDAIAALREEGYTICALEQAEGSISLEEFPVDSRKKYAVIAGNEVNGVAQAVVDDCDAIIEIPQFGTKHSLNVSVSVGITLWHFVEKILTQD